VRYVIKLRGTTPHAGKYVTTTKGRFSSDIMAARLFKTLPSAKANMYHKSSIYDGEIIPVAVFITELKK